MSAPLDGAATSAWPGGARGPIYTAALDVLRRAGVPSPEADARWLLEAATDQDSFDAMVRRRAAREPLQLIVGSTAFRHVELACRPGVFIPRPETEIVAGHAIDAALAAGAAPLVLEPCTGTGAIACALIDEVPGVRVIATDHSTRAAALAHENLSSVLQGRAAPGASAEVVRCYLLDDVDDALQGTVDVLVSNPPYLPADDVGSWEPEVAEFDPPDALIGGADGLEVVRNLLAQGRRWLRAGGTIVLEIDERRGDEVADAARRLGWQDATLHPDLTGATRLLTARWDGKPEDVDDLDGPAVGRRAEPERPDPPRALVPTPPEPSRPAPSVSLLGPQAPSGPTHHLTDLPAGPLDASSRPDDVLDDGRPEEDELA